MIPGMMGDDEKKIAMVIVGKPEQSEEPSDLVGLDAVAEEIIDAVKSGDKKMLKDALKSFVYLCKEDDDSEGDEYEE